MNRSSPVIDAYLSLVSLSSRTFSFHHKSRLSIWKLILQRARERDRTRVVIWSVIEFFLPSVSIAKYNLSPFTPSKWENATFLFLRRLQKGPVRFKFACSKTEISFRQKFKVCIWLKLCLPRGTGLKHLWTGFRRNNPLARSWLSVSSERCVISD